MKSFINLGQKDDETSIDYLKRFKAAQDVFYSHVGRDFCFPKLAADHADCAAHKAVVIGDKTTMQEKMAARLEIKKINKECMDKFTAHIHLENTDRSRYGSIMTGLDSQFSLGNAQCPKNLIDAQNVIQNHNYDPEYKHKKKQREEQQKESNKNEREKEETPPALSFATMRNQCYCCGYKDHKLPDCPIRETTPKDQWHINKTKGIPKLSEASNHRAMCMTCQK